MQLLPTLLIILFIIINSAESYITNSNLPEYREYVLRNQIARINPTTNAPQFTVEFITNSTMDPFTSVYLPSLCKEIETLSIPQIFIYCLVLLALWFMVISSVILYQLRTLISLKALINSADFGKEKKEKVENEHDPNQSDTQPKSIDQKTLRRMRTNRHDSGEGFELSLLARDQP